MQFHRHAGRRRSFSHSRHDRAASHVAPQPNAASPAPVVAPLTPERSAEIAASPFTQLGLAPALVRAVLDEGYAQPTPVQTRVVAQVLASRDVLACAQTGTGKTAAFVLPLLQLLAERPTSPRIRVLVLTPTRELAAQIAASIATYGRHLALRHAVVYGGVGERPQIAALRSNPDLVVATPGRLLDLMERGLVRLDGVEHYVLDEADRMLDMGFVRDVRRITAALPRRRQTLLFSATIPSSIEELSRSLLVDPVRVAVAPTVTTAERIEQSVVFVARQDKRPTLARILRDAAASRTIVFTRTKHGADRLSKQLADDGIRAEAIHGNKSQGARERALHAFRTGATPVLVATDVAARGIDVDGVSHVVNFDLPEVAEAYVHRIGRTGRAGAAGVAISFCDRDERRLLADIERHIRARLPVARLAERSERPVPTSFGGNEEARAKVTSTGGAADRAPSRSWHRGDLSQR